RQLDAHEHGAAKVMMAMEGKMLQLQFEVPSDSLIGFEYSPESEKDRKVFAYAMTILSNPTNLFDIPDEAECIPVGIKVSQTLFSGEGEHHEGEHHDHGDDHDDGKSEKDHDHDHDKDHDDHGDEVHSEFQASYLWNCHHADDLDSVQTRMMKVFPRIEEIRVQWIVGDRQGAMELENQDGKIRGWR
ncbi:MAG: DUF2796 domain-containing protein, partial [SAR324 cluster bacterium]|nr:DUF2796 domain-containing protein [SAR324 cluster bacterium]